VNPLASHWFRLAGWLLLASPIVAILVALTAHADFKLVLSVTLSIWALVCLVLALIALGGLVYRLGGWTVRAIRRRQHRADIARGLR
jgi:uncharacterized Tic20 family protein